MTTTKAQRVKCPYCGKRVALTITSVHVDSQGGWVFVRYGADHSSKATRSEDLRLLARTLRFG
jgi:hypothetical protein